MMETQSLLKMRWHESWIMRAAAMASMILLLGFAVSGFFTYSSIESIASIAHDPEIEASLGTHLESLKKIHELNQSLIETRLSASLGPVLANPGAGITVETLKPMVTLAVKGTELAQSPWVITESAKGQATVHDLPLIKWLNQEKLQVFKFTIEFPRGSTYGIFKATEDLRQRYQVVGLKLEAHIIPSLIKASVVVLIVSFLVLVSLFFAYAQRFKAGINEVIEGFSIWSEKDAKFRFDDTYPGELRLITHQFNEMADEVESNRQNSLYLEKIASWQIIARKLAHEIKNPLTPIQMMVSQLKRRYKGDDPAFGKLLEEAQAIITEEVAGLRRMVDSFSQFARLPEPKPQRANIVQLCQHVLDLQKNIFPEHSFSLKSSAPALWAVVDEDLIRQVVLNIVKNAGEACQNRSAAICIRLSETPTEVVIEVNDNGDGIPPDLIGRIFEAYFTTKHTGPSPGMGLGLAVCQKIVIDHGGTMTVKSQKGDTTFTIRIPKIWAA